MSTWKDCLLGDLLTFQRGYDLPKEKMSGHTYPVVGSNGIIGFHDEFTTEAPSITIGRSGNVGNPYIVFGRSWSHNTTLFVKEFKNADPIFIYYFLKTLKLGSFAGGSAVPTLNRNHIHSLTVHVPEKIEEQKRIGVILKVLDDKIDNNEKINKNLEEQGTSYFYHLFVDNTDPSWREGTINDLGKVIGGSTPSKSKSEYYTDHGIAWITPKDLSIDKSKFITHGADDITELGLKNSSATIMPAGTVLFSSRAPIGYIAIADGEVTTNQGFKSVVPNRDIGTAFVYYFLKYALPTIENMASGSTFKEISGSVMRTVPAIIPDDTSLRKFYELCEPLFQQQRTLEVENRFLASLRDSLLPKLMSGEIDVSSLEI